MNARRMNGAATAHGPARPWHALTPAAAVAALGSDAAVGLATAEAARRLAEHGPNQLRETPPPSLLTRFVGQSRDVMIWLLLAAAVISGALGEWVDTAAIVAIVVLNALISLVQEVRAEQALGALRHLAAPVARVVRAGAALAVPAAGVVPGDVLEVEAGDRLPADARLLDAFSLSIDESLLTGESTTVEKAAAAALPPDAPLAERSTMVFAGTLVAGGRGRAVVTATAMETELGRLAGLVQTAGLEPTPLQRRLAQVSRWLVLAAIVICAVVFALGLWRGVAAGEMFLTAVSLAVAAAPEGLPAVVAIVLALGTRRMARRRAIVRRLPAVETLGSTTVICSDKTGTLTRNEMTARAIWTPGRAATVALGDGDAGLDPAGRAALRGAALASALAPAALERAVGDPTEVAILRAAAAAGLDLAPAAHGLTLVGEIPFDSTRRRLTRLYASEDGAGLAAIKGAPDVVLALCDRVALPEGPVALDEAGRALVEAANAALSDRGLRVLAIAERWVEAEADLATAEEGVTLLGLVGLQDPPRPEAAGAIAACRRAGIRPVMITGDQPGTARAIGRELGLLAPDDRVLTGVEIDRLDDERLQVVVAETAAYARVTGEHKLRIVRAWRRRGEVVAMTGDGVNDAPAVKEADIGVAMGHAGSDVTKEAGDLVLADDNFATIVAAVEEGRVIADNIRKVLRFLLSCNAAEVGVMVAAVALGLPLPLLAVQILWMNLITDGLPALALGVEPAERDIMRRAPAPPRGPLMAAASLRDLLIEAIIMAGATLAALVLALRAGQSVEVARTMAFTTLVLAQLWQALNCRGEFAHLWHLGWTSNRPLLWAVVGAVALQLAVVYLPWAGTIFGTTPLGPTDLAVCLVLASLIWPAVELRKVVLKRPLLS